MLVVDASVAFKWVVREDGSKSARALAAGYETLTAPELVLVEVANAVWKGVQRGLLAPEQLDRAVRRLPGWFDEVQAIGPLLPRAAAIARELGHPVYDCIYLALAERSAATLVTADRRLLNRLADTAFAPLVRELGSAPTKG